MHDLGPGAVIYLPNDAWLAVRGHYLLTDFHDAGSDALLGLSATLSMRQLGGELRLLGNLGGESYLAWAQTQARELRARSLGLLAKRPVSGGWSLEGSAVRRMPDNGREDLHLHLGAVKKW